MSDIAIATTLPPKYEAVAIAYVADRQRIGWRAYQSVYTTASQHASESGFSRLWRIVEFRERINELTAEIADETIMSEREVLEGLSQIGRAKMLDYIKIGDDGQPFIDWRDLTPEKSAAIQEVTVEEFTDGRSDKREVRRVKFRLAQKKDALELLGKHYGSFVERVEVKHQHTVLHHLLKEIDEESREIVTIENDQEQGGDDVI